MVERVEEGDKGGDGQEGGEVEDQHNLFAGVDWALRNGPESKILGANSMKLS